MSKTRKWLTVAGIWLGVGLVVALALVAHPPTAGAKPSPTTVVDTTLPPPTTTLCNGSYKNCQPYPDEPVPDVDYTGGEPQPLPDVEPPSPPVGALPAVTG